MKARKRSRREVVRGEPIIDAVLEGTLAELAVSGFRALSVEKVALRAGVARTTIYRRWPTRVELVRAAIEAMPGAEADPPEGPDLRSKLIALCQRTARFLATPHGLAVLRLFAVDEGDRDLREATTRIRRARDAVLLDVLAQARTRGELAPNADIEMIAELFAAGLLSRALVRSAPINRPFIERFVDVLIASGAAAGAPASR